MIWMPLAGIGLAIERFDSHLLHQSGDMLSTHLFTIQIEAVPQHPGSSKGHLQMELVDLILMYGFLTHRFLHPAKICSTLKRGVSPLHQ